MELYDPTRDAQQSADPADANTRSLLKYLRRGADTASPSPAAAPPLTAAPSPAPALPVSAPDAAAPASPPAPASGVVARLGEQIRAQLGRMRKSTATPGSPT